MSCSKRNDREKAQRDIDLLLKASLPVAKEILRKHGGFHPLGFSMKTDGSIVAAASYVDEGDLTAQDQIELLVRGYRKEAEAGNLRAAAICVNVTVRPPDAAESTSAIQMNIEHESGEAVDVFLPYQISSKNELSWGEMFGGKGVANIFSSSPSQSSTQS